MSETIQGGCYKNAIGEGYHDAHGNPVDLPKVKEAERLNKEQLADEQKKLNDIQKQTPPVVVVPALAAKSDQKTK